MKILHSFDNIKDLLLTKNTFPWIHPKDSPLNILQMGPRISDKKRKHLQEITPLEVEARKKKRDEKETTSKSTPTSLNPPPNYLKTALAEDLEPITDQTEKASNKHINHSLFPLISSHLESGVFQRMKKSLQSKKKLKDWIDNYRLSSGGTLPFNDNTFRQDLFLRGGSFNFDQPLEDEVAKFEKSFAMLEEDVRRREADKERFANFLIDLVETFRSGASSTSQAIKSKLNDI